MAKRLIATLGLITGLALLVSSCGGGGTSEKDKQEAEETIRTLIGSGPEDVDYFLGHVTDDVLENFFGYTRESCREDAQACVGDPQVLESLLNLKVSDKKAGADVVTDSGGFRVELVKEEAVWKLDKLSALPKEIPAGVKKVDLELSEFALASSPAISRTTETSHLSSRT